MDASQDGKEVCGGSTGRSWDTAYRRVRRAAARRMVYERANHTLQPTALANEALERLARRADGLRFTGLNARAASEMERALIDHARRRSAAMRGGSTDPVGFDASIHGAVPCCGVDAVELADVIERLRALNAMHAQLFELRCFAGLSNRAAARELGMKERSVDREWRFVERWMLRQLYGRADGQ